jgi:FMN phosphatase YigB (HAD superfamily)
MSNSDERIHVILDGLGLKAWLTDSKNIWYPTTEPNGLPYRKPDPRVFEWIRKRYGISNAGECLSVGDCGMGDVRAAREAGWQSMQLDRNAMGSAPGTVRSLHDLFEYIE